MIRILRYPEYYVTQNIVQFSSIPTMCISDQKVQPFEIYSLSKESTASSAPIIGKGTVPEIKLGATSANYFRVQFCICYNTQRHT